MMKKKQEIVSLPPQAASLPEGLVRRHRAAPVRPATFDLRDPVSGKPVTPETVLTLPEGVTMTAGEYYALLGAAERTSASRGYSLTSRSPAPPEGVAMDTPALEKQAARIARGFVRRSRDHAIPAGASHAELQKRHDDAVAGDAARLEALKKSGALTARRVPLKIPPKVFEMLLGKPELLAAMATGRFDAGLLTSGRPGTMRILGDLALGASILKRPADFLKIALELLAPPEGQMSLRLAVSVAGKEILSLNESGDKPFTREQGTTQGFRIPVSFKLGTGPIGLSVEAAAVGEAGAGMFAAVRQAAADVKLTPSVRSRLEIAARADLKIAGASVKSDVVLTDGKLVIEGGAEMALQNGALAPRQKLTGDSALEMLAGKAVITGYIYQPAFSIPPFKKKEFSFNLWDWRGMKIAGRLFE